MDFSQVVLLHDISPPGADVRTPQSHCFRAEEGYGLSERGDNWIQIVHLKTLKHTLVPLHMLLWVEACALQYDPGNLAPLHIPTPPLPPLPEAKPVYGTEAAKRVMAIAREMTMADDSPPDFCPRYDSAGQRNNDPDAAKRLTEEEREFIRNELTKSNVEYKLWLQDQKLEPAVSAEEPLSAAERTLPLPGVEPTRPCGCALRGRHRATCTETGK